MYDLYLDFYNKYSKIYGEKTAIFLQVGSFYELYDSLDPTTGITDCNVNAIVDFIGIQVTVRKGDGLNNKDGLFAGVPDHSLHKWAGRLTNGGWTVVVIDQKKDRTGRVISRDVARILSPGTHIEALSANDIASFICIWFSMPEWGAAMFDLSTGVTKTASGTVHGDIQSGWTADDLVQFIQISSPREILICWRGEQLYCPDEMAFRRRLGCVQNLIHIRSGNADVQGQLEKTSVREEFLRRVYSPQTMMTVWDWLSIIEGSCEERALTTLLRFIEDHLPSAFQNLQQNIPWKPEQYMRLGNNALTQLQILTPRIQDSILGMYTSCVTPMGKRGIRERLLMPSASSTVIEQRLQEVDALFNISTDIMNNIVRMLRGMFDLPRIHRRIQAFIADSSDFIKLHITYTYTIHLLEYISKNVKVLYNDNEAQLLNNINKFLKEIFIKHIDIEKAEKNNEDISPFNSETWSNIHIIENQIQGIKNEIEAFAKTCRSVAGCSQDAIRMETRDKIPYGIRGTKIALASFKKNLGKVEGIIEGVEGIEISQLKSGGWIDSPWLEKKNAMIIGLREKLQKEIIQATESVCRDFTNNNNWWKAVENWLINIDCTQCLAREAVSRGYCRPVIAAEKTASISLKNLRHPIIESQQTRTEYVPHNVELGTHGTNGWLVYGMNASGKSSLMKATGIAIHLAQCGAYVPASECILSPFTALYTRILNHDNIYAGLSSFAVEMVELRDILKYADDNSIVLGDELCAGTETRSAEAIVTAGIHWFSKRNVKYIFATHLHGLLDILPEPSTLNLQIWHLRVVYNVAIKKLIYERHLRPGAGSSLYGLEVARALDLPVDFIDSAHKIRRQLLGSKVEEEATTSAWNPAVIRRACEQCGSEIVRDLEVHHIRPRVEATGNKFSDTGLMRDNQRNLIVVCQKCHDAHHAGQIELAPLVQTSDGPMRLTDNNDKTVKKVGQTKQSKWSELEQENIKTVLKEYPTMPAKHLVFKLSEEYDITISEATLRKIKQSGSI
jgi:DNA mismatch repair protein MutS